MQISLHNQARRTQENIEGGGGGEGGEEGGGGGWHIFQMDTRLCSP